MALEFAHGVTQWNAADAATTNYVISSLSFQPKALMFVIHGQQSAVDAASEALSGRFGIGFSSGTTQRFCVGMIDTDAAGTSDCGTAYHAAAVCVTVSAAGSIDGLLDLTAVASNGFTLTVDDAAPVNLSVFWYVWGGSDITNVDVAVVLEPGATGTVDNATNGTFEPTVVFFTGSHAITSGTGRAEAAGIMFGAGTASGSGNQFVFTTNQDDAFGTADTDRYGIDSESLALITLAGGNPDVRAAYEGVVVANSFRLNWLARTADVRKFPYMAIKGGQWKVGTLLVDAASDSVSGLAFQPEGAIIATHGTTLQSAGTSTTEGVISVGGFSSTSSERAMAYRSENGPTAMEIDLAIEYDACAILPSTAGGVDTSLQCSAIAADGFTLSRAIGSTNMTVGYVAFADAPTSVTLSGDSATASWSVAAGAISVVLALSGATSIATWNVAAGTVATRVALVPVGPVSSDWNVAAGTISVGGGTVTLEGVSASSDWQVPTQTLTTQVALTAPDASISTWNVAAGTVAVRIGLTAADSAIGTWSVPTQALSTRLALSGSSSSALWDVAAGSISVSGGGTVTLSGDSAASAWTVPTAGVSTYLALSGTSASSAWFVAAGSLQGEAGVVDIVTVEANIRQIVTLEANIRQTVTVQASLDQLVTVEAER